MPFKHTQHLVIMPPNWLGDVIMAQPAMRACMQHLDKDARISVCGRSWLKDLLPLLNLGNQATYVSSIPKNADAIILFPNSISSAWQAWRKHIPVRIGFRGQWRSQLLTHSLTPNIDMMVGHHRNYFLDLVEQLDIAIPTREVELSITDVARQAGIQLLEKHGLDPQRTICVAPGAQFGGAKRYPAESYSHILQWLSQQNWHILAVGTPAERHITELCLAKITTPKWNSAGETDLTAALQLVAISRLLLCNDSGLMHVAAGLGKPVVAMFGATDLKRTKPSGKHTRLLYQPAACSPCLQRECNTPGHPCMSNILPETVRNACLEMLEA